MSFEKRFLNGKHSDKYILLDLDMIEKYKDTKLYLDNNSYVRYMINDKYIYLRRDICDVSNENDRVFFNNGDIFDYRKSNLTVKTIKPVKKDNNLIKSAKYKGVYYDTKKCKHTAILKNVFRGELKSYNYGYYDNELEAAKAFDYYALDVYNNIAITNLKLGNYTLNEVEEEVYNNDVLSLSGFN